MSLIRYTFLASGTHRIVRGTTLCFCEAVKSLNHLTYAAFHLRILLARAVGTLEPSFLVELIEIDVTAGNGVA